MKQDIALWKVLVGFSPFLIASIFGFGSMWTKVQANEDAQKKQSEKITKVAEDTARIDERTKLILDLIRAQQGKGGG